MHNLIEIPLLIIATTRRHNPRHVQSEYATEFPIVLTLAAFTLSLLLPLLDSLSLAVLSVASFSVFAYCHGTWAAWVIGVAGVGYSWSEGLECWGVLAVAGVAGWIKVKTGSGAVGLLLAAALCQYSFQARLQALQQTTRIMELNHQINRQTISTIIFLAIAQFSCLIFNLKAAINFRYLAFVLIASTIYWTISHNFIVLAHVLIAAAILKGFSIDQLLKYRQPINDST